MSISSFEAIRYRGIRANCLCEELSDSQLPGKDGDPEEADCSYGVSVFPPQVGDRSMPTSIASTAPSPHGALHEVLGA